MGTKYQQSSGTKWHRMEDGRVARCNATVRVCPRAHYTTEAEAKDIVYLPRNSGQSVGTFGFGIKINGDKVENLNGMGTPNLRTISDRAKKVFQDTGKRALSPTGEFVVDFGFNRTLVVKHEAVRTGSEIGSQYRFTYWEDNVTYESDKVVLQTSSDRAHYIALQNKMQLFFNKAVDARVEEIRDEGFISADDIKNKTDEYAKSAQRAYKDCLKTVDEIEILSRGAEKAHKMYGVDLFSRDRPGELKINADCTYSALQPYDIVESLRVHAAEDDFVHSVALHISDSSGNKNSDWAISRIPEGVWFFSYSSGEETFSHELSPQKISGVNKMIDVILSRDKADGRVKTSRAEFVQQLLSDVEPAIQAYERAVEARVANHKETPEPQAETKRKGVRHQLFGLFS